VTACLICDRLSAEHMQRERTFREATSDLSNQDRKANPKEYFRLYSENVRARLRYERAKLELETHRRFHAKSA
jgi:hypothetical protein